MAPNEPDLSVLYEEVMNLLVCYALAGANKNYKFLVEARHKPQRISAASRGFSTTACPERRIFMNQITSTLTFHGTQFEVPQIVGSTALASLFFCTKGWARSAFSAWIFDKNPMQVTGGGDPP
jgi:hypothetical protein